MRPIEDEDLGIKVIVPKHSAAVDILAVHGTGAHPDDTWSAEDPSYRGVYINWLSHEDMLPKTLPMARVMRYGYGSKYFGPDKVHASPTTIADGLIKQLHALREHCPQRPLIIVAHSYGGIVIMQAVVDAISQNRSTFFALIGIIMFGTSIRGQPPSLRHKLLRFAYKHDREAYDAQLITSSDDSEFLHSLRGQFCAYLANNPKPRMAFFFEQKETDISRLFSREGRRDELYWVPEGSACLDLTDMAFEKFGRNCDHLKLNKFHSRYLPDYQTLERVLLNMLKAGPGIIAERKAARTRAPSVLRNRETPRSSESYNLSGSMTTVTNTPDSTANPWSRLGDSERWINSSAAGYWEQLTLDSYLIYVGICESCSKVKGAVPFNTLYAKLAPEVSTLQLETVWRRLLPDAGRRLLDMPPAYVLAILYMVHVERSQHDRQAGVLSEGRKRLCRRWAKWIPCNCMPQCGMHWSFANDVGLVQGKPDRCLVYGLRRTPEKDTHIKKIYDELVKTWVASV